MLPLPALALETALAESTAAVRLPDGRSFDGGGSGAKSHNESAAGLVQGLLGRAGIAPEDLRCLVVGAGPGSFTGLRIGFSFMQGLACSLRIPLLAVSSLLGCAACQRERRLIVVSADAGRGECYCGLFRLEDGRGLCEVLPARILPRAEIPRELEEHAARYGLAPADAAWIDLAPAADGPGVRAPLSPAAGLLAVAEVNGLSPVPYAPERLSRLEPNYLRAVAAKSIAERARDAVDKKRSID